MTSLLGKLKSYCKKRQSRIVSKEKGKKHCADNSKALDLVRHYHLNRNKNIITQGKCCDFLLLNDTKKRAYFIELEGSDKDEALEQLKATIDLLQSEIPNYEQLLRIVVTRMGPVSLYSPKFRKASDDYGDRLRCGEKKLKDKL